jgi:tRNA(adenine34) deaminase
VKAGRGSKRFVDHDWDRDSDAPIHFRRKERLTSMSKLGDKHFMRLALEQARIGTQTPGGAEVGAVLVKGGNVVCSSFNEGNMRNDPTAHAEIVVIRKACDELQRMTLEECTLYCTLQPCGMCTMACLWAGVSRIVYGAGRRDVNGVYFETRHANTADFIRDAFRNDLQVEGGILNDECAALYRAKDEKPDAPLDPAHVATKRPTF